MLQESLPDSMRGYLCCAISLSTQREAALTSALPLALLLTKGVTPSAFTISCETFSSSPEIYECQFSLAQWNTLGRLVLLTLRVVFGYS